METLNFIPLGGAIATYSSEWHEVQLGDGYELTSPKNPYEPSVWEVRQITKPSIFNYLKAFFDVNLEKSFYWDYSDIFNSYDNITTPRKTYTCDGFSYKLKSSNRIEIYFSLRETNG